VEYQKVTLGGKEYEVALEVSSEKASVWVKVRPEGDNTFFWYVVGLQSDGSIVRATSCEGSGLPLDVRTGGAYKVAIRNWPL
jgi:hypothetical protein